MAHPLHAEVEALLNRCRRRRMALRGVESSGLTAAASLLAVSWALVGWWAWPHSPGSATTWALVGLLLTWGGYWALGGAKRRVEADVPAWYVAAGVCLASGALALIGGPQTIGAWQWALGCGLAGAVIGGFLAALGARSPEAVAREADANLGLQGRLITARQVVSGGDASSAGLCVCRQALDAIQAAPRARCVVWRRGRGLVALLITACLVSVACAALATPEPAPESFSQRLASSMGALSTAQRQRLARSLRERAFDRPDVQRDVLRRAAQALEQRDADALRELSEALGAAGVDLEAFATPDVRAAVGAANGQGQADPQQGPQAKAPRPAQPATGDVLVYHPEYPTGDGPESPEIDDEGRPVGRYTSPTSAWDTARREALDALSAGRVPPRRQNWVRRYFQAVE